MIVLANSRGCVGGRVCRKVRFSLSSEGPTLGVYKDVSQSALHMSSIVDLNQSFTLRDNLVVRPLRATVAAAFAQATAAATAAQR